MNYRKEVPFSKDDFKRWRKEPTALAEDYFPGISDLVKQRGQHHYPYANLPWWGM